MKPAMALAAAAQSLVGRDDIARLVRRVDRLVGLTRWLLGFVVVLLGWQIALLFALIGGIIELGAYAGIHLFGCCVLAAWLVRRSKAPAIDDRYSAALQIVAWSAFAGPFGAFIAAALSLPSFPVRSEVLHDGDVDDLTGDHSSAIDHVERMHITLLDHRIRLEGACYTRPLIDVIAEGSRSEKLQALGVVYRKYEARLSAVLKRALQDSDMSVRVLAATVTAKLHATHTRKIGDCQASSAEPGRAQGWRDLAEVRLAYAESGLLEAAQVRAQLEAAVGDLSRAAELDPDDRPTARLLDRTRRQLAAWRT